MPVPIEIVPGLSVHTDHMGEYLNVINGFRKTENNPDNYKNTIWMFGGCVFFGYAIEDGNTIASSLQRKITEQFESGWRVLNAGLWGGNFDRSYLRMEMLPFREGDIVIVSHAMGNVLTVDGCKNVDISAALNDDKKNQIKFWDRVVHCGKIGYNRMADLLLSEILPFISWHGTENHRQFLLPCDHVTVYSNDFDCYISEIKSATGQLNLPNGGLIGAIVMNCNPFTLGHYYLIKKASEMADYLYVFIVEEDRSFFPFEDRIRLVKNGISELNNVYVHRSGKWMISSTTFPGYFIKGMPEAVSMDSGIDVDIFARIIAPALNISIRFVGEEPNDAVTRQYNEKMKEILPLYEIKLVEIPRKVMGDDKSIPISASLVRQYLKEKDFQSLRKLVPETTYTYLYNKFK